MDDIDSPCLHTQLSTAFLAVDNSHITFSALCRNFPLREVKNYLTEAIEVLEKPSEEDGFGLRFDMYPHGLDFYRRCYKAFRQMFLEEKPEVFI